MTVRRRAAILHLSAWCLLVACGDSPLSPSPDPSPANDGPGVFTRDYRHAGAFSLTVTVGLWMHRAQVFDRASIADWLGVPHEGRELLEPVNVLWLDGEALTEGGAIDGVVAFLEACGFRRQGSVLGITKHSTGYSAAYGDGLWKEQHRRDDTWVQGLLGSEFSNNHGRIFPAHAVAADGGGTVFATTGAFSREGSLGNPILVGLDCALNRENCHPYRSFNRARDELACGAPGWALVGRLDIGNAFPLSQGLSFSTGDHDGVLVFERAGAAP